MRERINRDIRRLVNVLIVIFVALSAVAAYIQVSNRAFFNGPVLAQGPYAPLSCPPKAVPLRGTIYDRNGIWLARTVPDPNATCGYRRVYNPVAVQAGLGPLLGYFSYKYGTAGIEATYNDQLAGIEYSTTLQDFEARLLHKPRYGADVYLTIDLRLQEAANNLYNQSALEGGVCQPPGSNPPGALIVEDPSTGEILALVSRPAYDPNRIDDPAYWRQITSDPDAPLLDHATQGLYVPGSTFKTVTLAAALDTGLVSLGTTFSRNQAIYFTVNGQHLVWSDYFNDWRGVVSFPLSVEAAYAYSDNIAYARLAVQMGAQTWLNYVGRFGIAIPGRNVPPVPFDAPYTQSRAYNPTTDGQPTTFDANLLASSGFGQGQLLISPLTMTEITSAVAANGVLWDPHVVWKVVPHGVNPNDVAPVSPVMYGGGPVFSAQTAASIRRAMWAVATYGTGAAGLQRNGVYPYQTFVYMGGKTGTGQLHSGLPQAWWISLAPDDQAPGGGPARLVITISKEHSGEGACQVWVANDLYQYAFDHHLAPSG
jgi:peptidoglycan glycosyltransferase